ncbi:MAG TPA: phosphoglycerate mutase family protein [Terriglobales bacterium]|nr:phosphoglycerate mutase family protein [Terriglobales bacterium]
MNNRRFTFYALMGILLAVSMLAAAQENSGQVFLVRHAEKASDAKDALLSARGHERANCLAHLLADAGIREILVTRVVRTQQTAEPLAKKLGITPTILEADDIAAFVNRLQAARNENVLVVGHADTLPNIIEKLGGGRIALENSDYDKLFVLHYGASGTSGTVTTLHYCDCK